MMVTGTLKFFYENELYGFFVGDADGRDLFFHFDDIKASNPNFTTDYLTIIARDPFVTLRFAYSKLNYFGRYGLSMKAVNIVFIGMVYCSI
jgi:hypothetical protein